LQKRGDIYRYTSNKTTKNGREFDFRWGCVAAHQDHIFSIYRDQQREFLRFVLDQYIKEGVGELDDSKLPDLTELKYHGVDDAVSVLGSVAHIRDTFIGFQKHLYARQAAM